MIRVAVDAMSGDRGHVVAVDAALACLRQSPELQVILVGDEQAITATLGRRRNVPHDRLSIRHAAEVVGMCESPAKALRSKKDSSMRVAIDLVKADEADACVSAGNTGALMATARFVLKTVGGIDRPAIISALPSRSGITLMLDLGANAECSADQLLQFAVMGAVLAEAVYAMTEPRVGLLNIGTEELKGNGQVQDAHHLLSETELNYVGFVEGNDIYYGDIDVVVCDGFIGNVALKTSEGLGKLITLYLREAFMRNALTRVAAVFAAPVLKAFRKRVDPRQYNGATFAGLQGIVVKSHGDADTFAFANAIKQAQTEVAQRVPSRIGRLLEQNLPIDEER